jgi:2-keto-4-pentenoate hydratase/2-oxohepta-3-ene-1,7-dioic acid hydratase in catechol pathway
MRLLSFQADDKTAFGALVEGRIVDLSSHMPELASIRDLLKQQMLVRALDIAAEASADYSLKEVKLLPPVVDPRVLICVPLTANHLEPCFSIQVTQLLGHDQPLSTESTGSSGSEAEVRTAAGAIAAIIGKPTENVPQAEAQTHIAGLSLINLTGNPQVTDDIITGYRNISAGFGPCLVTLDEIPVAEPLELTIGINDAVSMVSVAELDQAIRHASTFESLMPGDVVILLPVPAHLQPELEPGDQLSLEVAELGRLENSIPAQLPTELPTQLPTEQEDSQ